MIKASLLTAALSLALRDMDVEYEDDHFIENYRPPELPEIDLKHSPLFETQETWRRQGKRRAAQQK